MEDNVTMDQNRKALRRSDPEIFEAIVGEEDRQRRGMELIPSEIERLIIPLPAKAKVDLINLDKGIRSMPTEQVLAGQGKAVLGALGLSSSKQDLVLAGWRKLRDRRHRVSTEALDA